MLRYYQKKLKELEKSSGKHEAVGEVEEPHYEQVVNGQTSVNNRKRKKSDQPETGIRTHLTTRDSELSPRKKEKRLKSKEVWRVIEAANRHDNVNANEDRKRKKKKKKKNKEKIKRLEFDAGNSSSKKKEKRMRSKKDWKVIEAANSHDNVNANEVRKRKKKNKEKIKRLEFDAGNSDGRERFSTQFNESGIDPPIMSNNKEKKRKRKCLTELPEGTISAKTSKSQKRREESNFSCNGRTENLLASNSVESSNLTATTNTSPGSSPQSSTHVFKRSSQSGKESAEENQKRKKRKKRNKDQKSTKHSTSDSILNSNDNGTEVVRERAEPTLKMNEAKLREAVKTSDRIHETWTLSKERLQALAKEGIRVKKGKWSNLEHDLLKFNMARFLERHNLSDPDPLLFHSSMDAMEAKNWKRFARSNGFFKELGKGIQRELFSIYKCATRIYDKTNYVGKFTEDETKELKRLHSIHDNDWVTIGQLMDRSRMSVNRKHLKLPPKGGKLKQEGKWTDDELKRLHEAVHFVTNTAEGESVFHDINWQGVAKMVKTRSAHMCRGKWLNKVCWSMSQDSTGSKWSKSHELKLITRVYNSGVTEECDVDWMDAKSAYDVNYSPQWLRSKWAEVKKNVPNYQRLSFEDIVDYLYSVYSQTIRDNLQTGASNSKKE